jgi:aspartyl-tRNA(Asn)/glutamyl-tRNA(Gln) amidotransferase subunit B
LNSAFNIQHSALQVFTTIGLEVHAQLRTSSKIFCGCSAAFGAGPNTHVCPVCLGLPGALPVLNGKAVELAVRAALAFGCTIHPVSRFARKHYFYPDLPKGYQISQYDEPLATGGALTVDTLGTPHRVGLIRLHLEEDAGKSLHAGDAGTAIDFNRSGVPLIEIVTAPEIDSPALAAACFARIRDVLVALGVTDGNMEEGSLRCDANVSVRPDLASPLGVKTEIKNINSFRYVQRALLFEVERQLDRLGRGLPVEPETRLWDSATGRTVSMRGKEEAQDYRYFPEPDLPALVLEPAWIDAIRQATPELPEARRDRFTRQYGLPAYDAGVLTQSPALADYFEAVAAASGSPKAASNWIMGDVLARLHAAGATVGELRISPEALAGLIRLVESGRITGPTAKQVFEQMFTSGGDAEAIVAASGLTRVDDDEAIATLVRETLARHPGPVAQYRAGRRQAFGFLVGQVMKASDGRADPGKVSAAVRQILAGP